MDNWDKVYNLSSIQFDRWPQDRKITIEQKEIAKQKREKIKTEYTKIRNKYMMYNSEKANEDIYLAYDILNILKNIVFEFIDRFAEKKKQKNIIDFNDIEHFALEILLKEDENCNYTKTEVAKKYQEKYIEIAIDEYQDSNLVQEYILNTISKNNIFMVGDIKQSIYKFRQAKPELFLKKYQEYKDINQKQENENLKIKLFKNFRSRSQVLDITNLIFENLMSTDLGDINYNEEEYLTLGAKYPDYNLLKPELNIIDLKKQEDEEEEVQEERIENTLLEAKFVAKRIKELINSKYQVYDKNNGYRNITYKDIVILLRTTNNISPIYEKELLDLNLPVFSDVGEQYLDSIEVQTVLSLLKIIDNPIQDIPLVTVLRSSIADFTEDELMQIRLVDTNVSFYECMLKAVINVDEILRKKIEDFLKLVDNLRQISEYIPLDELIWKIYIDTGYLNYVSLMPNGNIRQANLKMLFQRAKQYESSTFKGLFNFINFIEKIRISNNDLSSAKLIGENENVIRIMSIHKSKGLEFPVVFLSGTAKRFNLKDLNQTITLHDEFGIGPEYIDYERKIKYDTLAKSAIKAKINQETLSEELRILYVALTRSKEKLIITGLSNDIEKALKEKEDLINMYENKENKKINPVIVKKCKSYLEWLELVYVNNKDKIEDLINMNIYSKLDLLKEINTDKVQTEQNIEEILNSDIKQDRDIEKLLEWKYKYKEDINIKTKTSVSDIKHNLTNNEGNKNFRYTLSIPKFLNEDIKLNNAQKGTVMHMCIQSLDINTQYDKVSIKNMIDNMVLSKLLTISEADSVDIDKMYAYINSNLWASLKQAKQVYKEKPFYIYLKAKDVYGIESEENVLVQGIIDLYYVDKDDNLILVDYKTDYVENEKELIDKYSIQLDLYKKALEQSLKRKVDKVYIYSTHLNKLIEK